MLPTAIIFFREILEIALILGIIGAATRGVAGRGRWILFGLLAGLLGSAVVAYFADTIAALVDGMGQEVFNAIIMLIAAFMIGWTVVWVKTHVRELVSKIKKVGKQVSEGELPLYALAIVISVAMWREGSEIVLFMYGVLATSDESLVAIITGGLSGAVAAAVLGTLLYLGLLKIPMKYFFTVTEWMLILLAAGLASQAAGYLIAADIIPALSPELWDSSRLLAEDTLIGQVLHAMTGYISRPTGMHVVIYAATIAIILGCMQLANRPKLSVNPA